MLAAYRSQSWKEALALARELKGMKIPGLELEMLYALYAQRIEQYAAVSPGQDWDGVTIAMSK
jgi:hypothetical protein